MKVRKLHIEHFRGINACDWHLPSDLVCLVGPGDSTKTTLLDAMGLVLSRSYRPQFSDADFYNCDTSQSIVIEAVVTHLPDGLVEERAFGKERSGLLADGTLVHDPVTNADECLIVRLTVDASLEPIWQVVRPGESEGRPISAAQRAQLGFFRVGEYVDLHLRWGRASALTALTESRSSASSAILDAHRETRRAVFAAPPAELQAAADVVKARAHALGSARYSNLRPGLDPIDGFTTHSLVLHDHEIPLTNHGLGTRRLTSLSIQDEGVTGGSIIAIDEVEHGLEPHRLAHVLRYLKVRAADAQLQVFMTTHSPVVVTSLAAADLGVVRSIDGETVVLSVPNDVDDVQGTIRQAPAALLSRCVMVGEGATEVGLIRGLCDHWDANVLPPEPTSVTIGWSVTDGGGGAAAVRRAQDLVALGYPVTVLLDNDDRNVDEAVACAEGVGVTVSRWSVGSALEDEIARNVSLEGLQACVDAAIEERGEESVRMSVQRHVDHGTDLKGTKVEDWLHVCDDETSLRSAIAAAAKGQRNDDDKDHGRAWFKRQTGGAKLAVIVMREWSVIKDTSLGEGLSHLKAAIYGLEANASGDA